MNNLDAYCGFVHEMQSTKAPLVYDLQEPFRCLVDVTIIKALEGNVFKKNDFIRTDNYEIRIRPNGTKKLIDALDRTFSQTTKFKGMKNQWYRIIQFNARDFSQYLRGNRKKIDLSEPEFKIEQVDDISLKKKILDISYSQWERWGFSRGTLWYMKEKARSSDHLNLNKHVMERLNAI